MPVDPFARLAALEAQLAALVDSARDAADRLCRAQAELAALCAARACASPVTATSAATPALRSVHAAPSDPAPESVRTC